MSSADRFRVGMRLSGVGVKKSHVVLAYRQRKMSEADMLRWLMFLAFLIVAPLTAALSLRVAAA